MTTLSTSRGTQMLCALKTQAFCVLFMVFALSNTLFSAPLPPAEPAITSFSPKNGAPGTLLTVKGRGLAGAKKVTLGDAQLLIISTTDTAAVAMVMPNIPSGPVRLQTSAGKYLYAGTNFTVTATPYPSAQQGPKLIDTAVLTSPSFPNEKLGLQGMSTAISADGNTAIAESMNFYGYPAYLVYSRINGVWLKSGVIPGELTGYDQVNNIALSADGNTALFGREFGGSRAVRLYRRNNGAWADAGTLKDSVGSFVALSADGKTAILGKQEIGGNYGSGYTPKGITIFKFNGNSWQQMQVPNVPVDSIQVLEKIPGAQMRFDENGNLLNELRMLTLFTELPGSRVAISADGKTAASASFGRYGRYNPSSVGYVVIYALTSAGWQVQVKLPEAGHIALSADGNTLLSGNEVYVRTGQTWALQKKFPQGYYGSLSADGNTAVFPGLPPLVYVRSGGTWVKKESVPASTGNTTLSMSLSADGTTAICGMPGDTTLKTPDQQLPFNNYIIPGEPAGSVTMFTVQPPKPGIFATGLTFTNTTTNTTTLSWKNGDGGLRAVFLKIGTTGFPTVTTGITYNASAEFASGSMAGTGWYCVYNGSGTNVNITGLAAGTAYRAAVIEYNGSNGTQQYLNTAGAPANVTTLAPAMVQASNLTFSNIASTTATISWQSGNGAGRAVFVANQTNGEPLPANMYYSPNTRFQSGSQAGGWYCIYNGTGNTVNVIGLSSGNSYRVAVVEYGGTVSAPVYNLTGIVPANLTTTVAPPTGYAANLTFSNTTATTTTLSWQSSNGTARAVFLKQGGSGAFNLVQGQTYNGSSTFGTGSPVGSNGWYCVYNGTGSSVNIAGLSASAAYRAIVIEYNGGPGAEAYNLSRYNTANVTTLAAPVLLLTTAQKRMLVEQEPLNDDAGVEVNVHQALSPNGDGVNDVFTIDGIGAYPDNVVKVISSNGDVIYSADGYNNYSKAFDGRAANGTLQKAGTYFYSLEYKKGKETVRKTGYLILKY